MEVEIRNKKIYRIINTIEQLNEETGAKEEVTIFKDYTDDDIEILKNLNIQRNKHILEIQEEIKKDEEIINLIRQ